MAPARAQEARVPGSAMAASPSAHATWVWPWQRRPVHARRAPRYERVVPYRRKPSRVIIIRRSAPKRVHRLSDTARIKSEVRVAPVAITREVPLPTPAPERQQKQQPAEVTPLPPPNVTQSPPPKVARPQRPKLMQQQRRAAQLTPRVPAPPLVKQPQQQQSPQQQPAQATPSTPPAQTQTAQPTHVNGYQPLHMSRTEPEEIGLVPDHYFWLRDRLQAAQDPFDASPAGCCRRRARSAPQPTTPATSSARRSPRPIRPCRCASSCSASTAPAS